MKPNKYDSPSQWSNWGKANFGRNKTSSAMVTEIMGDKTPGTIPEIPIALVREFLKAKPAPEFGEEAQ